MTDAAERVRDPRRQHRAMTDVGPRQPSRRRPLPGPIPKGRLHAICAGRRELFICGRIDGKPFYREFRVGSPALPGPAGTHPPGRIVEFSGGFVRIADPATDEVHRLDMFQFIRLNWNHGHQHAECAQ